MPRLLSLVPNARVVVAESERDEYARFVPAGQLDTHPDLRGMAAIRNHILDHSPADCVVMIDDDLKCVERLVGSRAKIKDPQTIAEIIENARQCAEDLGIGVFCFNRSANTVLVTPEAIPFRMVMPVSCTFGVRGPARQRRFDPQMPGKADLDYTLRTLADDRVLWADCRWLFDHGRVFGGRGGAVGVLTDDQVEATNLKLKARWGPFINLSKGVIGQKKSASRSADSMSIKVKRTNPTAVF